MDCSHTDAQPTVNCLDQSIKNLADFSSTSPLKSATNSIVKLRKLNSRSSDHCFATILATTSSYRISMANLEETHESELDVILGELSLLEAQINNSDSLLSGGEAAPSEGVCSGEGGCGVGGVLTLNGLGAAGTLLNMNCGGSSLHSSGSSTSTHSRTSSSISGATISYSGSSSESSGPHSENGVVGREPRTESPDNDSAFSDTVSLLSSESSASSSVSAANHHKQTQQHRHHHHHHHHHHHQHQHQHQQQNIHHHRFTHQITNDGGAGVGGLSSQQLLMDENSKAAKIQLALHKLEHASIRRLFVKAFTSDGASKSLLVDERMTCGHVTRLLADKNHVSMQANWALVENLGDLQMERLFEDHELLVDNLMTWNSDAGNRVLFLQRADKVALFAQPEIYLPGPQMAPGTRHDENTRAMLLEEFFETGSQLQLDGPLYLKADSKKGWKRYHFVLRSSGLYYFPKEKTKNTRDLVCLTLFNGYNLYRGVGWRKKWKAPTDYTFGFKASVDSSLGKTCRTLRMLCAEDVETMDKWLTALRISKYGKQLWDNHKSLLDDLQRHSDGISMSDSLVNSMFAASMRSESISSISSAVPSQCGSVSSAISTMSSSSSGRISRASSSSSSGCLSDDNNGFDSEFTTGTIKRKPSMKPNLPLTTMTRQLKEVGEIIICESDKGACSITESTSPERSGTLTRRHNRRKSQESNCSSSGTLKKRQLNAIAKRGSIESMNTTNSSSSNSTPTPTPSICSRSLPVAPDYGDSVSRAGVTNNNLRLDSNIMTSSTLSLDSLPPPPPPLSLADEHEIYGSQLSLANLPPPPPPEDIVATMPQVQVMKLHYSSTTAPPAVPAKPVKMAPPYKAPPDYDVGLIGSSSANGTGVAGTTGTMAGTSIQKKVSFADSPVLLRRKMCSPEPWSPTVSHLYAAASPLLSSTTTPSSSSTTVNRITNFSHFSPLRMEVSHGADMPSSEECMSSPKRLQESTSNPPRDFLKDLQRVMRKKWQVAQKCKLEPATTPHEVLGFRDFNDISMTHEINATTAAAATTSSASSSSSSSSHYYRETANVSNWVQEHYGTGTPVPMASEYALYENLNNSDTMMVEPQFPIAMAMSTSPLVIPLSSSSQRKKRPPPPPPKRSDSTHLTHRV